ncbi:MAG: N-6 DNA methylase [Phycisphaerae bacterium]|nr:N-6 DNA methylase [Phycisphaerae bacterium]
MTRAAHITEKKATGAHYTPPALARFVARRILRQLGRRRSDPLRVLDPACGAGALLEAFELSAREEGRKADELVGVEADEEGLGLARLQLRANVGDRLTLIHGDFLDLAASDEGLAGLWGPPRPPTDWQEAFDVVIANPPYVRTQVLGAAKSRRLAQRFSLSGRVDLYHAFLVAITGSLRPGGTLGIIVSNRFLTTVTGAAVRRYLASHYDICEIIDLGDTKLFEAAVLPAVFVGQRKPFNPNCRADRSPSFVRVYSASPSAKETPAPRVSAAIYEVLEEGRDGLYCLPGGVYRVSTGTMDLRRDAGQVWSMTTPGETQWVKHVRSRAAGNFADVSHIRVGIKTTADSVFIRDDWEAMPAASRPEPSLLLPLLGHQDAQRWARPTGAPPAKRVLYPHQMRNGRRAAIDLACFPRARHYLQSHQARLRARRYLAESGRQWYEIWVPQDPDAWAGPKVVFPDISPAPCFFRDSSSSLVNGNCYWMTLRPGLSEDLLYLLLGLANSDVMTRFHDLAFGNKLYSGRRRYITQYVGKYPYPDPTTRPARELVQTVKNLVAASGNDVAEELRSRLECQIEKLARDCFALDTD